MTDKDKKMEESVMTDGASTIAYNPRVNFTIVIVSFLFVAVFTGALVGGVSTEDPTNGFYMTIIVSSCMAIGAATIFFIRYWWKNRFSQIELKEPKTYSGDEDDEEKGDTNAEGDYPDRLIPNTPPGQLINEVKTGGSVTGEVSAISPCTGLDTGYEVESISDESGYTSFVGRIIRNRSRQKKSRFYFSSTASMNKRGQDPPEAEKKVGPQDPAATVIDVDGHIKSIDEEDISDVEMNAQTSNNMTTSTPVSVAGSLANSIFGAFSTKKEASAPPELPTGRPPKTPNAAKKYLKSLQEINSNSDLETQHKKNTSTPSGLRSVPTPKDAPSSLPGVKRVEPSFILESASSDVSSTFNEEAHEKALSHARDNRSSLGADQSDMPLFYEDKEEQGRYDVYAPSGPIGIVVDTTEKGCVVHSLKKTSSMKGLIKPGDLIIALDDANVRDMDAATLTRLMAKKSRQVERKFTLIASDI